MDRAQRLRQWLQSALRSNALELAPASDDASFRRYYRVHSPHSDASLIVMDAPPEKEDCRQFVHVATLFRESRVHVPQIHAQNLDEGFLLLSDLGTKTYLDALAEPETADELYSEAFESLVRIQRATRAGALPEYDRRLLYAEIGLFRDWYLGRQLGRRLESARLEMLENAFASVLANNLAQAQVFVHRDYHSRNLMVSDPNPGILDFQDAVIGPITYDLVSLLRDAYIEWEDERVAQWAAGYWERARQAGLPVSEDFAGFYRDFEWMGVQRHLKVLGIFARLYFRDGKRGYLKDQPRVMRYLKRVCERYRELSGLARLLDELEDPAQDVPGFSSDRSANAGGSDLKGSRA